jgi:NADH-quinone oxidoreductase subunit J
MNVQYISTNFSEIFGFVLLGIVLCLFITNNIITKILCLIGFFFFLSLITLTLGADFLAALFLIIYVGAIAVLFLFIIMLLDIKISPENPFYLKIMAACVLVTFLTFYFYFSFNPALTFAGSDVIYQFHYINNFDEITNAGVFGLYLFDYHIPSVLLIGIILLVALVGSIGLTLSYTVQRVPADVSRKLSRHSNTISLFK